MQSCDSRKRKCINDFFQPFSKLSNSPHTKATQPQVTTSPSVKVPSLIPYPRLTPVPGLSLHPNFINPAEERIILAFLTDPSRHTWRTDLSRRTLHFGGTYCLMPSKTFTLPPSPHTKPQIHQAPPMPSELSWLLDRMITNGICSAHQRPQYCIVNEYHGALGISAHTENFAFGEPVAGLSLLDACPMRFHELEEACDGSVRSGKAAKAKRTGR